MIILEELISGRVKNAFSLPKEKIGHIIKFICGLKHACCIQATPPFTIPPVPVPLVQPPIETVVKPLIEKPPVLVETPRRRRRPLSNRASTNAFMESLGNVWPSIAGISPERCSVHWYAHDFYPFLSFL
ncbi:hypothetical protein AVEN_156019-1 [Araneus ventricosus]|uniref:Uncharacterized protein n=1 Tax=Araneus ventricosus TaxID=182803 RepID=A0A4Y2TKC9_ARAVE|nr:hypothetical protein AVEN_156019-1 [Araneus ventricosus]